MAQGQAKANDALSRSINPILVQYKSIENGMEFYHRFRVEGFPSSIWGRMKDS